MTINPDLDHALALAIAHESPALMVRVLCLLCVEVQRLEREIERIEGGCKSMAVDLTTLGKLHTNARPGHGYATMAGEHSTPIERAINAYTTDKAVTEYLTSKERDYWAKE